MTPSIFYIPGEPAPCPSVTIGNGAEPSDEPANIPFPLECLPPDAANMAHAICATERVPETLAGCCSLGMISASIGAGLQVVSGADRVTRGNVFILASAVSGSGKSETFRHSAKPLQEFEAARLKAWETETRPGALARKDLIEQDIDKLKKDARKKGDVEREEIRMELQTKRAELASVEAELNPPRLTVEDVTTEKLAVMLAGAGECLASHSPDAGGVVNNILGRYNKVERTDENIYLKAFSGEFCRVDRQSRPPVVLHKPCLSVLWLTQPDKIESLLAERSLTEGGLLPRFLICHTRAEPQLITGDSPGIPPATARAWEKLVLDSLQTFRLAAEAFTVKPDPDAKEALKAHHNRIVGRRRAELVDVGSYAARWNEQAWRIAVCIHAGKHGANAGERNLDLATAQAAITLADWFAGQQMEILAVGRFAAKRARQDQVLGMLADKPDGITARDVQRGGLAHKADEARALLDELERDGLLAGRDHTPGGGGHVTRIYRKARG